MTKICKKCGVEKPTEEFRVQNSYGNRRGECKECAARIRREAYVADPEPYKKASSKWQRENRKRASATKLALYHKNPGRYNATRRNWKYKLADGQYESMLSAQGGGCAICGGSKRLSVDHCHDTGVVRGILCFHCNTAIGHLGDSFQRILKAASYLRKFSPDFLS